MLTKFISTSKIHLNQKYQLVINRREKAEIKQEKNSREFINYSKTIDDVYENLKDHNLTKIKSVKSV